MSIDLADAVLLILLSGIFGWLLGRLPVQVVYGVMALTVLLAIVVLTR